MKTHAVKIKAKESGGEYVLGMKDLHTHACYLIYGELEPGESGREFCPGAGHEEILLVVKGEVALSGELEGTLSEGEAVHLQEEGTCQLSNPGPEKAVYVMAGGHSGKHH